MPAVSDYIEFAEEQKGISLEMSAQRPLMETPAAQPVITTSPLATEFQAYLTVRDGDQRGQRFLLEQVEMIVGRGESSNILILDASLSLQHARFSQQPDGMYVQDLLSRNGTKVNDLLLRRPRRLRDGDIIILGNVSLEYSLLLQKQETPPSLLVPPPATRLQPLRLPSKKKEPPTTQNERA
jgi:pSer/pThr/pTyr-binding forkhead associated (FHA) protein